MDLFSEVRATLNPKLLDQTVSFHDVLEEVEARTNVDIRFTKRSYVIIGTWSQMQLVREILEKNYSNKLSLAVESYPSPHSSRSTHSTSSTPGIHSLDEFSRSNKESCPSFNFQSIPPFQREDPEFATLRESGIDTLAMIHHHSIDTTVKHADKPDGPITKTTTSTGKEPTTLPDEDKAPKAMSTNKNIADNIEFPEMMMDTDMWEYMEKKHAYELQQLTKEYGATWKVTCEGDLTKLKIVPARGKRIPEDKLEAAQGFLGDLYQNLFSSVVVEGCDVPADFDDQEACKSARDEVDGMFYHVIIKQSDYDPRVFRFIGEEAEAKQARYTFMELIGMRSIRGRTYHSANYSKMAEGAAGGTTHFHPEGAVGYTQISHEPQSLSKHGTNPEPKRITSTSSSSDEDKTNLKPNGVEGYTQVLHGRSPSNDAIASSSDSSSDEDEAQGQTQRISATDEWDMQHNKGEDPQATFARRDDEVDIYPPGESNGITTDTSISCNIAPDMPLEKGDADYPPRVSSSTGGNLIDLDIDLAEKGTQGRNNSSVDHKKGKKSDTSREAYHTVVIQTLTASQMSHDGNELQSNFYSRPQGSFHDLLKCKSYDEVTQSNDCGRIKKSDEDEFALDWLDKSVEDDKTPLPDYARQPSNDGDVQDKKSEAHAELTVFPEREEKSEPSKQRAKFSASGGVMPTLNPFDSKDSLKLSIPSSTERGTESARNSAVQNQTTDSQTHRTQSLIREEVAESRANSADVDPGYGRRGQGWSRRLERLAVDVCDVCMKDIVEPREMPCGDIYCQSCADYHLRKDHTCPRCGADWWTETGNQPEGELNIVIDKKMSLAGYTKVGTICVSFLFGGGKTQEMGSEPGISYRAFKRTAYLPNNAEGRSLLKQLKKVFDRKLLFAVSRYDNDLVGVVEEVGVTLKTEPSGENGYPDPHYLEILKNDLKYRGATYDV